MKNFGQAMLARMEFGVVVGGAFGYPIIVSLLRGFGLQQQKVISGHNLLMLGAYELVVGAFLLSFLWFRGWTPQKIGLQPTSRDTGIGLLLLAASTIAGVVVFYATYFISPQTVAHMQEIRAQLRAAAAPIGIIVSVSVIN